MFSCSQAGLELYIYPRIALILLLVCFSTSDFMQSWESKSRLCPLQARMLTVGSSPQPFQPCYASSVHPTRVKGEEKVSLAVWLDLTCYKSSSLAIRSCILCSSVAGFPALGTMHLKYCKKVSERCSVCCLNLSFVLFYFLERCQFGQACCRLHTCVSKWGVSELLQMGPKYLAE